MNNQDEHRKQKERPSPTKGSSPKGFSPKGMARGGWDCGSFCALPSATGGGLELGTVVVVRDLASGRHLHCRESKQAPKDAVSSFGGVPDKGSRFAVFSVGNNVVKLLSVRSGLWLHARRSGSDVCDKQPRNNSVCHWHNGTDRGSLWEVIPGGGGLRNVRSRLYLALASSIDSGNAVDAHLPLPARTAGLLAKLQLLERNFAAEDRRLTAAEGRLGKIVGTPTNEASTEALVAASVSSGAAVAVVKPHPKPHASQSEAARPLEFARRAGVADSLESYTVYVKALVGRAVATVHKNGRAAPWKEVRCADDANAGVLVVTEAQAFQPEVTYRFKYEPLTGTIT